jgi:hypothetical protein
LQLMEAKGLESSELVREVKRAVRSWISWCGVCVAVVSSL